MQELTSYQQKMRLKRMPSILEYLSYIFAFGNLLAGEPSLLQPEHARLLSQIIATLAVDDRQHFLGCACAGMCCGVLHPGGLCRAQL